jgi:molybdopterin-guanine dinucleotide biosynthesis protein A
MGADKALLPFRDQTLLAHALQIAAAVAEKVVIVGPRARYSAYGDVVEDVYTNCGPLAGIHAALGATQTEINLVLSVDMPLMLPEFLRWLLDQARNTSDVIVVPDALGGQQPLCAVYRRSVQDLAEQALKNGDYKIGHLFSHVPTCYISESEMRAAGFSPDIFRNVNTVAEYEALIQEKGASLAEVKESGRG